MKQFEASPVEMFNSAWRNRSLIARMVHREVIARYRGSTFGILWSLINPILMLAVYTFVFGVVFQARWNIGTGDKVEFAIVLFAGLIVFNLFAECFNKGPTLVLINPNYVKKIIFPLEILPWISLGAALFHFLVSLGVLLTFMLLMNFPLFGTIFLLPALLVPLVFFLLGAGWILSSLGVYIRDVSQTVGFFTTVLMFLSPVFYPVTALPVEYRAWLELNPLAYVIERIRDIVVFGRLPGMLSLAAYSVVTLFIGWCGFFWFQKTRRGFADVL